MINSRPILLSDFESYLNSGELESQFVCLGDPTTQLNSMNIANLEGNISKHRYPDLGAYDKTRVILSRTDGDPYSDYINANWIDGYSRKRQYIVTQAPLESTVVDFYRMIWENNVHQIIMLANPHDVESGKCAKYWPEKHGIWGDIEIVFQKSKLKTDPNFLQRNFTIRNGSVVRPLIHYQFLGWPDLGIPHDAFQILKLIHVYRKSDSYSKDWPVLVHCSAGVGRTGSFVLGDAMVEMAMNQNHVDYFEYFTCLRNQRISMIEKPQQYFFSHQILLKALNNGDIKINY